MIKKNGFTLAEVLITLGIIGIVAAMTLPALTSYKKQKELETALKKNASVIEQTMLLIAKDEGDLSPEMFPYHTLKKYMMKNMKIIRDCGNGIELSACVPNSTFQTNVGLVNSRYRTYNNSSIIHENFIDDGQFLLADGSLILIENNDAGVLISVDVNGFNKGPNLLGHDLFTFELLKGGLKPSGAEDTTYKLCDKNSTSNLNGFGCTYKALTEKDYFKNLP